MKLIWRVVQKISFCYFFFFHSNFSRSSMNYKRTAVWSTCNGLYVSRSFNLWMSLNCILLTVTFHCHEFRTIFTSQVGLGGSHFFRARLIRLGCKLNASVSPKAKFVLPQLPEYTTLPQRKSQQRLTHRRKGNRWPISKYFNSRWREKSCTISRWCLYHFPTDLRYAYRRFIFDKERIAFCTDEEAYPDEKILSVYWRGHTNRSN